MKKILIALFLMLFFPYVFASESVTYFDEVRVDLIKIDPSPVEAGQITDVWFEVYNIANEDLSDLEFKVVEKFPFSSESPTVKIKNLLSGEKKKIKFSVYVDENIEEGAYDLYLQYKSKRTEKITSYSFELNVKKTSMGTTLIEVKLNPKIVEPGGKTNITFKIKNGGNYLMKDIGLKLLLDNVPFVPLEMTAEKKIEELPSGKSAFLNFLLGTTPDAEAGMYKIPIKIEYYDKFGNKFEKEDVFGIIVGSVPDVYVELKSNEIRNKNGVGTVILNVVNKGLVDIKFLKVKLLPSSQYEIISSDSIYVGDIDSDDFESAEFKLKLNNAREVNLPLVLEYRDANNVKYETKTDISFKVYSKRELGEESRSYVFLIVILLVIIVAIFYYRYRRKKSK